MRYFVIGDEDTVLGFRYAGIEGRVVQIAGEAREAFEEACHDASVAVVIMNDEVARSIREEVDRVRLEGARPLVVEVPGPEGPSKEKVSLRRLIQQAVGIRV